MVDEKPIGEIIKELREQKGLSQRRLSLLSGVDRGYINQIEAGKAGSITLRIARSITNALMSVGN